MVRGRAPRRRSGPKVDFQTALGRLDATRSRNTAQVTPLRATAPANTGTRPGHSIAAPPSVLSTILATPGTAEDARRRRRDLILALGGLATFTLLFAVALGGVFVAIHLLADVALLGYVMAVAQRQRLADERLEKVTPLRPPAQRPAALVEPAPLLRRSGT